MFTNQTRATMPRFQVNIRKHQHQQIELLRKKLFIGTLKALFNYAIMVLKFLLQQREDGFRIVAIKGDLRRELREPHLDAVEEIPDGGG